MEAAEAALAAEVMERAGEAAVDEARNALLQPRERLVRLCACEPAGGHGGVELLFRSGDQGLHESFDGLAVRGRDLRERLTALELASELGRRQAQVCRRGVQARSVMPEALVGAGEEQRKLSGLDPLLQRVALILRQASGRNRGVDAVLEGFLQGVAELRRFDPGVPNLLAATAAPPPAASNATAAPAASLRFALVSIPSSHQIALRAS